MLAGEDVLCIVLIGICFGLDKWVGFGWCGCCVCVYLCVERGLLELKICDEI